MSAVVDVDRLTPLWRIYANMLFLRRADADPAQPLPRVVYRQKAQPVNTDLLAAYRQVCGEGPPNRLPPLYPHIMATPLQLNLLDSDDFPHSLAGLVHVGQVVEWRRALHVDDVLDIECAMRGPESSAHGWLFTLDTCAMRAGECVWREEITFLKRDLSRRARPKRRGREGDANRYAPLLHLQFPEDSGRRYARASGDWNPIHLWPFTAKQFGFQRPIAHGMFSLARCLSILETRGADLVGQRMEASFRAPVMLPAYTNFSLAGKNQDESFALIDARKGRILLEGRLTPL